MYTPRASSGSPDRLPFATLQGGALVALMLVAILGCPPARQDVSGQQVGSSALMLSVDYPSLQTSAATLLIPREQGMTCELASYSLADDDEDYLSVAFARGDLYEWAGEYAPAGSSDECSGINYYYYSSIDDQRCLISLNGVDSQGQPVALNENSLLRITSHDSTRITGSIRASDGQFEHFNALNCGERMQYGYTDGDTTPSPGRENPPSPWALRFR